MELTNEHVIIEASTLAAPREACGLVYADTAFILPNTARDGTRFFIMDMAEQAELWRHYGGPPQAVWHSHPNDDPNPSPSDLEYHPPGMRMLIVAGGKVHDHGYPTGP